MAGVCEAAADEERAWPRPPSTVSGPAARPPPRDFLLPGRRPLHRVVMLDLDGTLVDTVPDLSYCLDRTLNALGLPAAGEDKARQWVGSGIEGLLHRALADGLRDETRGSALFPRALECFHSLYARNTSARSRLYPGVCKGLHYLEARGVRLACITNKSTRHARNVLSDFALLSRLDLVVGGDTLARRKPAPDPLLHALRRLRCPAGDALFVGDSLYDVHAARAAGVPVVCVSYGYHRGNDLRAAGTCAVIASLEDLREWFDGAEPRAGRGELGLRE